MRYDRVEVLRSNVLMIVVGEGKTKELTAGMTHLLETFTVNDREYIVLKATKVGAITKHWDELERKGDVRITRVPDHNDPTWHDVPLPIISRSQLSEHHMKQVLAYWAKGKLVCTKCALKYDLTKPEGIPIYPDNLLPYSQDCWDCGQLLTMVAMKKVGGPMILFEKPLPPPKKIPRS